MSLKLVPESKNLHKSFTVIFGVILLVTSIAQALATAGFLESVKPLLSPEAFAIVGAGFFYSHYCRSLCISNISIVRIRP